MALGVETFKFLVLTTIASVNVCVIALMSVSGRPSRSEEKSSMDIAGWLFGAIRSGFLVSKLMIAGMIIAKKTI